MKSQSALDSSGMVQNFTTLQPRSDQKPPYRSISKSKQGIKVSKGPLVSSLDQGQLKQQLHSISHPYTTLATKPNFQNGRAGNNIVPKQSHQNLIAN